MVFSISYRIEHGRVHSGSVDKQGNLVPTYQTTPTYGFHYLNVALQDVNRRARTLQPLHDSAAFFLRQQSPGGYYLRRLIDDRHGVDHLGNSRQGCAPAKPSK